MKKRNRARRARKGGTGIWHGLAWRACSRARRPRRRTRRPSPGRRTARRRRSCRRRWRRPTPASRPGTADPFGTVIVKDGEIVGRGHNRVVVNQDPTCHGEMEAIRDACRNLGTFDLSGCELYTTAEPCPMCLGATLWANIPVVYYGWHARGLGRNRLPGRGILRVSGGGKRPADGERVRAGRVALSCLRHTRRSREKRRTEKRAYRWRE